LSGDIAGHVGIETHVHQAHAEGAERQAFPAQTEAGDPLRARYRRAEPLERRLIAPIQDGTDFIEYGRSHFGKARHCALQTTVPAQLGPF
jgi:hypothetical protein